MGSNPIITRNLALTFCFEGAGLSKRFNFLFACAHCSSAVHVLRSPDHRYSAPLVMMATCRSVSEEHIYRPLPLLTLHRSSHMQLMAPHWHKLPDKH